MAAGRGGGAQRATTTYINLATLEWARQWPSEEVWKARRRG
ncbi:MAG TPA: hypothetical protein VII26_02670 [Candidatus Limnocylindria bacterium]